MSHELTIEPDGYWFCSCGEWNGKLLGKIGSDYTVKHGITEETIRKWHRSHANAIVIEIPKIGEDYVRSIS